MSFTITEHENEVAKNRVREHLAEISSVHTDYWLEQKNVKCYLGWIETRLCCFCLLYEIKSDLFGNAKRSYLISYISTLPDYGQKGYGTRLLTYLSTRDQTLACCANPIAFGLFGKCGYTMDAIRELAVSPLI